MDKCREEFEKFARWYALPLDKSEDGVYLALETQSAWTACQSWQAKVEKLEQALEKQEKLALRAINEAKNGSLLELRVAEKLKSESSPESLESERAMNAQLTEENLRLEAQLEELQVQLKGAEERAQLTLKYKDKYRDERDELQKRVDKAITALKSKIAKVQKYEQDSFDHGAIIGLESALRTVEQALKGEAIQNLNTDEKGECRHFSTTMFSNGKAQCFHCDAVVNEKREVIGKQSKAFSWPSMENKL